MTTITPTDNNLESRLSIPVVGGKIFDFLKNTYQNLAFRGILIPVYSAQEFEQKYPDKVIPQQELPDLPVVDSRLFIYTQNRNSQYAGQMPSEMRNYFNTKINEINASNPDKKPLMLRRGLSLDRQGDEVVPYEIVNSEGRSEVVQIINDCLKLGPKYDLHVSTIMPADCKEKRRHYTQAA